MHCEKNLCKNVLKTIFGEKDTPMVRHDMQESHIRSHLWLQPLERRRGKFIKPPAPYVMKDSEKVEFIRIIQNLRTPSNYVSAFRSRVHSDGTLRGLKSHDYHILIQQVLPLCLRNLMPKCPRMALIKLSRVFQKICCRIVDPTTYESLREDVALVLCLLEKEFTFFF